MHPTAYQLVLNLFFVLGTTMGIKHFFLIFGITPTVCSRVVNQMLTLVVQKLNRHHQLERSLPMWIKWRVSPGKSIGMSLKLMM